jgi:hypothetical protein
MAATVFFTSARRVQKHDSAAPTSCGFTIVIIQQSAKTLPTRHRSRFSFRLDRYDQPISEALMVALDVIQLDNEIPILAKHERCITRGIRGEIAGYR